MTDNRPRSLLERLTGTTPAVDDGLVELPDDAPKGTKAAHLLMGQQLAELRNLQQSLTSFAARLQGFLQNDLLATELIALDANGQAFRSFRAQAGAVVIRNLSAANAMTITQGNPGGAPTTGRGTWKIPANTKDTIAINSAQFTVYGTAGDLFNMQAFTRGLTPIT
jgi:hypothetical protein